MRKQWLRFSIFFITIGLLVSVVVVRPYALTSDRVAENKLAKDYVQAMELIRDNYVQELGYEPLTSAAIQGMLRVLDPHSNYYDRKAFEEMRLEQRSQYYGIGASIQGRHRGVYIIETFKDTPAARAGLRYGDQIIAVDGESSLDWNSDKVRDHLRGELGTEVKVTVQREGEDKPVTVKLERAAVDLPSISGTYLLKPGMGYVALSRGFHSTTSDELTASIAGLKEQGMTSMVLDLRGNPGGFLDQAIRVADKFLLRGQGIVSVRNREGKSGDRDWPAESGVPETFPLVVLIDDGTASASEIVTGAIQDHDRGLVIGEPSFGKGLVQTIYPLPAGAGLTLTTARYYTPSGRLIQRDYSNGSSYEYLFRRNSNGDTPPAKPKNDMRKTDLGRPVFGGGGIEPDIKVEAPVVSNLQGAIWTTGLFMFVRELVAGKVAAAPSFKRSTIEFDHHPQPNEFVITDEIMKAYREFMVGFVAKNEDYGLTIKMVDDNLVWSRQKIREEVLTAAYGVDTQKQMTTELDPQLQRAIAVMPESQQLAEKARRMAKASKK
ncbi:MAG TPA: S41 family peptidase [Blastocatellia bacterium]|nr:S41 family peptidase [Blastocatellia bacterium]HMV86349.1 S41 family peptidase [Blastocatellia bacterium]HMX25113.1 S41 family peptidase [Blastocatellia bacterium]HMY71473.1 S41 family peptidase [Blastocatellia bacterium]HMZ17575.1 S41 family peptidase [Blastocatellia bacterium]